MNAYSGRKFIAHFLSAHNEHGIHSPFVFDLYSKVAKQIQQSEDIAQIEQQRNRLLADSRILHTHDLGSGSAVLPHPDRKISDIARYFLSSEKEALFIYKLIQYLKPNTILELGTSLGITSSYMAKAAPHASITTLEGCAETAKIAKETFKQLNCTNIDLIVGNIDTTLCSTLPRIGKLDLALVDANHTYDATIRYFNQLIDASHNESCLIFDDIYQKEEMTQAWQEISKDSRINVVLDFFHFGIVFPRSEQRKQYFKLRF